MCSPWRQCVSALCLFTGEGGYCNLKKTNIDFLFSCNVSKEGVFMQCKDKVTIDTVAERAKVSKATVSRYLNGKLKMISEDKQERIFHAINELKYKPNRTAQSLKSKTSGMIGCIVSDMGSPFSSILTKGINKECIKRGYQLILTDSEDDAVIEKNAINSLIERNVDGLIINSTGNNDRFILELYEKGLPIVLADRPLATEGEIDTVTTNNAESIKMALLYLKKIGYTKIAFFSSAVKTNEVRKIRYQAFCQNVQEIFKYPGEEYAYFYSDLMDCKDKLNIFISNNPSERIAILAINGVCLLDVLKVIINYTGINIGTEIGICGFDNWGWADLIGPGITTITQNTWKVGETAAKLLFERILENPQAEARTKVLNNLLEVRGSTVCFAK